MLFLKYWIRFPVHSYFHGPEWNILFIFQAEDTTEDAFIQKNAVDIVRQLQKLKGIDGDYDSDSVQDGQLGRRKTIHNLERQRNKKQAIGTLDVAFKKRFFSISAEAAENGMETGRSCFCKCVIYWYNVCQIKIWLPTLDIKILSYVV